MRTCPFGTLAIFHRSDDIINLGGLSRITAATLSFFIPHPATLVFPIWVTVTTQGDVREALL
jgi:hypothetical protein